MGVGKAVTISGLGLSGADSGNYRIAEPNITASIVPNDSSQKVLYLDRPYVVLNSSVIDSTGTLTVRGANAGDNLVVKQKKAVEMNNSDSIGSSASAQNEPEQSSDLFGNWIDGCSPVKFGERPRCTQRVRGGL